jgi:hypothetical protein
MGLPITYIYSSKIWFLHCCNYMGGYLNFNVLEPLYYTKVPTELFVTGATKQRMQFKKAASVSQLIACMVGIDTAKNYEQHEH